MSLVVTNAGERLMAEYALGKTAPSTLTLRLFTNNASLSEATVAGDLTELSGNGYAAQALTGASWTVTEGDPTVAQHPQMTFTASGGGWGNVYGYYITNASGALIWAELFSGGPIPISNAGETIKITPRLEVS
jgi:hypothetical protein